MGSDGLGQLVEALLDIQAGAQDAGKSREGGEPSPPSLLPMEEHDVFDERPDQVGHLPGRGDVGLRVRCPA